MAKTFSEEYYGKAFKKIKGISDDAPKETENAKMLRFAMEGLNLDPINIANPQEVYDRCNMYFSRCQAEDLRPGIANMCVWIGISRNEWQKWCDGVRFRNTHMEMCNKINGLFDAMMENYMQTGKINPVSGIFLMKNNLGYENDTPQKVETKNTPIIEKPMTELLMLASGDDIKKAKKKNP